MNLKFPMASSLFPNPTSNVLHIEKPEHLDILEMNVYNTLGQLVNSYGWQQRIDTSSWASGMLFIQFQTSDGTITKSVLKK